MKKEIEELLKSDLTSYKIAKETGITVQQIDRYRKSSKVGNITLDNAIKLYNYKERLDMKNYDKMMVIVNELVLEEGATVTYWNGDKPNDCTCCCSVEELKAHLGRMEEDDYEELVFQVDFEDEEKAYQFYLSDYENVVDKEAFTMSLLRNER